LFVAYYNFYANKSRTSGLGITTNRSGTYLGSQSTFDEKFFKQALDYINKGISKFPNRLDMRFGKTYLLGQNQQYKDFTDEIVKAVDYSNVNKNQWLWMENKPVENPQKFMLGAVQDYVVQLFDSGDESDDHTNYIKSISETVLKYYPNSVENLSNISIYYLFKDDFDNALIHLLKAEKLAPQDAIVLNNIALCYGGKKDKPNALKYFNLVIKYGNEDQQADAKEKIKELNKMK
jgi:tetratricopeptide (TPR) repeat protein